MNYILKSKVLRNNSFLLAGMVAAVLLSILLPLFASAETVVRTGDSVSIGVNQMVENNLYAAAGSVSVSGEVKEDMYVLAGSVTVNGPIGVDLTAVGGTIQTHANIGGDLRVIGGDVVIANDVGGDVFVVGGHLNILSSAKVTGNVYFYGGEAEIDGVVEGNIMGQGDLFSINNSVQGTDLSARRVVLGEQANIQKDLRYESAHALERAAGAVVGGDVLMSTAVEVPERGSKMFPLMFLTAWLFASLSTLLFFRSGLEKLLIGIKINPAKVGLLGLACLLAAPVLSIILIITVLGSWIGFGLLLITLLFSLVSLVILPLFLGSYILSFFRSKKQVDIWSAFLGMLIVLILINIPFVGVLAVFCVFVLTLGTVTYTLYKAVRS